MSTAFPAPRRIETNGATLSVHVAGPDTGPALVFCHGFPELAFSWRHQVAALGAAGFRAIAPDLRGYGGSTPLKSVEEGALDVHVGDMTGLLDALGVEKAIFVGHDWGGALVWAMPQARPERTAGVISLNTPFVGHGEIDLLTIVREMRGPTNYMVRFQEAEKPDAFLAANVERVFPAFMRRCGVTLEEFAQQPAAVQALPLELFVGEPQLLGAPLMEPAELATFIDAYKRTGFFGGLAWYRNMRRNWEIAGTWPKVNKVDVPSLFIMAADDYYIPPAMSEGMEAFVPDLERHLIPRCFHWTQQEHPDEVNRLMLDWLKRRFPKGW
jgi:pimeloyl-ACP methyl ester carboxylesterase